MKAFIAAATIGFVATVIAQTTTPSPSQVSAFWSDTDDYISSLASNPSIESLYSAITSELPESVQDDLDPTSILTQVFSIGTNTGVPVADLTGTPSVPTYSWETYLNGSIRTQLQSLATSVALVEQTFIKENLNSGATSPYVPKGMGWVLGAAAGAAGIAALLL